MSAVRRLGSAAPETVAETAAGWVVRRHGGLDRRDEGAFLDWLAASPEHKAAYDDQVNSWAALNTMAAASRISAWRSEALMAYPPRRSFPLKRTAFAVACGLALIVGTVGQLYSPNAVVQPSTATIQNFEMRTGRGERSITLLADGSKVKLDADTRLHVDFVASERRVVLLSGHADFEVAHDKSRPFIVDAADREVVALGTEFSVRVGRGKVAVTLTKGKVEVRSRADVSGTGAAIAPARLSPGARFVFATGDDRPNTSSGSASAARDGPTGSVRFDATPLEDVIAEMNRYGAKPILIKDPRLLELRVSGVFETDRPDIFVEGLISLFPVDADDEEGGIQLNWRGSS